ncbi:MAG: recombinase family protein [Acidiphilium sp.]|nr:recombinase family protein [Acidiphilium sp.]
MTVPLRAALYLRVSTARQAEHDVSIPDQKRQGEAYCASRGYQLVETYVEPGASATNDRRPEFQRMIEAGTSKPAPFDVVIVHSFSRFFRDAFDMEFYVRKLAKNGVKLLSITQEIGDDPVHQMMRQIMALFDEYQSKENAKHVMRALKENARQGFWNGSLPPIGYRVVAAEQRGAKTKKKLEIDPLHADTVRLIYRLALEGDGATGQMGVKNIVSYLNSRRIFTRDGGRWGIGQVHRILTRRTYMGEHEFNKRSKTKELKPVSEIVTVPVPPIIDRETFDTVQALLKARNPKVTPSAVISGPTMLIGLIHCAKCGGAMTIRTGKGGRYRYYACSMKARQGPTACEGMAVPMDKLDDLVASHLEDQLLQPERLEIILASVLDRRQEQSERRREHIAELNKRAAESELRLKRLYDAIEAGVADIDDPALKDRIDGLKAIRDQAKADAERAQAMLDTSGAKAITPQMVRTFAKTARQRIRLEGGGYRRDHLRALAQRVEVADGEVRIMGSKTRLLQALTGKNSVNSVPTQGLKWRVCSSVSVGRGKPELPAGPARSRAKPEAARGAQPKASTERVRISSAAVP